MKSMVLRTRVEQEALVEFAQRENGAWAYRPAGSTPVERAHDLVGNVSSYKLQRRVHPSEGDLFEAAIKETFGHSSQYELIASDSNAPR